MSDDNCELITLFEVDRFRFIPQKIIGDVFGSEEELGRKAWQDTIPSHLKFTAGTLTNENLMIFTKTNCYKLTKNQNGVFGQKSIQLIPEISFKSLFISNLKHVYLIMDQKHQHSGLSYFDLSRVMSPKAELGKNYKDHTMWLQFAQVGI